MLIKTYSSYADMKKAWSAKEVEILRKNWVSWEGAQNVRKLLPNRSTLSIRLKAIRSGIKFKKGHKKKVTHAELLANTTKQQNGCITWNGSKSSLGYGSAYHDGHARLVSRLIYAMSYPNTKMDGLLVLHRCDNPPCINIDHLYLGTHKQNSQDMVRRGRQRHSGYIGSLSPFAKLKEEQIPMIRNRFDAGEPTARIAPDFGVSRNTIRMIGIRKKWKHVE